jgi:hypothetical protein
MTPYDLPEPKGGGAVKLKAETYQAIVSMLRALWSGENVVGGPNVLKRERADAGFSLSATGGGGVGAAKDDAHPFKIILKAGPTPSTRLLSVLPGLVDDVMPTLDGDPLWTVPSPTVEITMPQDVPLNVFIQSTIVAGRVTQPTIQTALTDEMPEETDSLSFHIIGSINPNGTVSQYTKTNMAYQALAMAFDPNNRLIRHLYIRQ